MLKSLPASDLGVGGTLACLLISTKNTEQCHLNHLIKVLQARREILRSVNRGKLLIAHGVMVNVLVQLFMLIKTAMIRLSGLIYLPSFQALSGQFST
jgi:hypothetical protein